MSTSRLFFRSWMKLSSLILVRSLLVVCIFSLTFHLIWNFHSMILWLDRKSLFMMSWIVSGLLLMSQSRVFPSLCVCMFMCWCRSYMSKISCMLVVSGCSGLFQGILKSPKMMIFLELLSRDEMWSGNSSKKVSIVTRCFVEYGAL